MAWWREFYLIVNFARQGWRRAPPHENYSHRHGFHLLVGSVDHPFTTFGRARHAVEAAIGQFGKALRKTAVFLNEGA